MKTPSQVYKPSATQYTTNKVELLYPERMSLRTVSGSGFIKCHSRMIPLMEALAGYTVAIDPQSGPPYDLWFAHRRIAVVTLDGPRPVVDVASPPFITLNELHRGDTEPLPPPALETA